MHVLKFRRQSESHQHLDGLMGQSHCSRAQGYNDNSGLGPILAKYLEHESDRGQILVLIMNKLGDDQMIKYFRFDDSYGGMICEGDKLFLNDASASQVFHKILDIQQESFQELGGEYIRRYPHERTCAIRLASNRFFEVL